MPKPEYRDTGAPSLARRRSTVEVSSAEHRATVGWLPTVALMPDDQAHRSQSFDAHDGSKARDGTPLDEKAGSDKATASKL